jgi:hypothetical protein
MRPEQPFELHKQLFAAIYSSWSEDRLGPAPVWVPDVQQVQHTNIARFMNRFHVSYILHGWQDIVHGILLQFVGVPVAAC